MREAMGQERKSDRRRTVCVARGTVGRLRRVASRASKRWGLLPAVVALLAILGIAAGGSGAAQPAAPQQAPPSARPPSAPQAPATSSAGFAQAADEVLQQM